MDEHLFSLQDRVLQNTHFSLAQFTEEIGRQRVLIGGNLGRCKNVVPIRERNFPKKRADWLEMQVHTC